MVGIMLKSKVGEKGQIVIPKPIRDQFGIMPFSDVIFTVEEGKIIIQKKDPEKWLQEFTEAWKDKIRPLKNIDWDEMYYSQFE